MTGPPRGSILALAALGCLVAIVLSAIAPSMRELGDGRSIAPPEAASERAPPIEEPPAAGDPAPSPSGAARRPLAAAPEGRELAVVALRADDRAPVVGAEIAACDFNALLAEFGRRVPKPDRAERGDIFHSMASRATTDDAGRARVEVRGETLLIDVTHGSGLWGRRVIGPRPVGPVEILLDRDRTLQARVLAATDGRPVAGVPVALRGGGRRADAVQPTRGEEGIATFPHVQVTMGPESGWRLGFGFPLRDPAEIGVDLETWPEEPVPMTLPPTGRLEIRVRDEEGRAVGGGEVALEITAFETTDRVRELAPTVPPPPFGEEGVALVPFLGLGLPLRVTVTPRDPESPHRPVLVDAEGPRLPGETASCAVVWGSAADPTARYPAVTGRFVRGDGRPWPRAEIEAYPSIFPLPREPVNRAVVPVADGGTFRIHLRTPCPAGGRRVLRLICRAPEDLAGIEGRLDLSRALPPGDTDLGDVVLDHGALLVSGTVVDADDRPLRDARVDLLQLVLEDGRAFWPTYDCAGRSHLSSAGEFALHAIPGRELPTERLRLRARCEGLAPARDLDVALGQRDVRVVLARGGSLVGSIRFQPGQAASDVAVVLRGDEGTWVPTVTDEGRFEQGMLPAGTMRLTAYLRSVSDAERRASQLEVEGLRIASGETNRDPRVQDLELRGTTPKLTLRVRDERGRPIEGAAVETPQFPPVLTDAAGVASLRPPETPIDVRVTAFGYREALLEALDGDSEVALSRGLEVRLVTGAPPIGLDPAYHLGFFLYRETERGARASLLWGRNMPYDRMYFDERGEALLAMPGPGAYIVEPMVFVDGKDNVGRGGPVSLDPAPRITVLDTPRLQTFRIEIPRAVLDATVRGFVR